MDNSYLVRFIRSIMFVFVLVFNFVSSHTAENTGTANTTKEEDEYVRPDGSHFGVFYSLQDVLDNFNVPDYRRIPSVRKLVSTFEAHCRPRWPFTPIYSRRRFPFILVESTHKNNRRYLAKKLAKSLGAKYVATMPRCFMKLRDSFKDDIALKRMFYALSMYVTAFNVRHIINDSPVVLSGYWMDQAAFNIAKEFASGIPPPTSRLYEFPKDLLAPDIAFFLNVPPKPTEIVGNDVIYFNSRITEVYRRLRDPGVVELNSTFLRLENMGELRVLLRRELQDRFQHLNL